MALRTPLPLQDTCLIHLMLRAEDFTVGSLALLSHTIRRKLFFGLSMVDILHFGDSLIKPSDSPSDDVAARMIDAHRCLLNAVFNGSSACPVLSLNIESALLDDHHDADVIRAHICACYSSLEPTSIYGFLFPKRSLPFIDLQSRLNKPLLRSSLVWRLLLYCNTQSAPPVPELKIDIHDFKSNFIWIEFEKCMTGIKKDTYVSAVSNPRIYLTIPYIQELSSVEVLQIGSYTTQYQSPTLEEDTHVIPYVLLYNILTSNRPRLKHIKVYGIPETIKRVMSTVVELLCATCTAPSKSLFLTHTSLEPILSLPSAPPCMLEGISVLPYEDFQQDYDFEFTTDTCASSISHDLMRMLELHMHKLKSVMVHDLGYCCDLDRMTIVDGHVTSGRTNINVPEYRALLALLVEFIKQPQFTQLTVVKSPLPEGFELIRAFLCTPASHEQSLKIEASSQRSVEQAEDNDNEEEEDEEIQENWIVNENEMKEKGTPPAKKFKFYSPMKPPCFCSLPLTNAQFKCLDLGRSSDCVYSWLFHQLPVLKLKSLTMRTLDMNIVPANAVIQVEHVAFDLGRFRSSEEPAISQAHLEKFVVLNPVIKRLELKNDWDWDDENAEVSFLPALNSCLLELEQQGKRLEELILTFLWLEKYNKTQLKEFFIRLRDISHCCGTVLVLSLFLFRDTAESDFFTRLSEEFQAKKIKKIVCYAPDVDPTPQLQLIAEIVTVKSCKPPSVYY